MLAREVPRRGVALAGFVLSFKPGLLLPQAISVLELLADPTSSPPQALSEEPLDLLGDVSPSDSSPHQQHTYEKIRAVSDFAPIKERVRK